MHILLTIVFLGSFPIKQVQTLSNKTILLDTVKTPIYISFWAFWCKQCIKELDKINRIKDTIGLGVISISEDGERKKMRVISFAKGRQWAFPVVLDKNQSYMKKFGVVALPSSFLFDKNGNIIHKFTGFSPEDKKILIRIVDSLKNANSSDTTTSPQ